MEKALGILGLIIAAIGIIAAIIVPEIRCQIGLDSCSIPVSSYDKLTIVQFQHEDNAFVVEYANPRGLNVEAFRFNVDHWEFFRGDKEQIGPNLYRLKDDNVKVGVRYCYKLGIRPSRNADLEDVVQICDIF